MQKINLRYRKNITEVYKIITMLSEDEREKIPHRITEFFKENSLDYLLDKINMTSEIIENNLSITTKKLLKLVTIYL